MEKPTNIVPIDKLEIGMRVLILKGPLKNSILRIKSIDILSEKITFNEGHLWFESQGSFWAVEGARPQPKTPHPIVALFQKEKQQELSKQGLELDLDYELASLHDAMERKDQSEIERSKKRLAEIHKELESNK